MGSNSTPCPRCDGKGKLSNGFDTARCPDCHGTGQALAEAPATKHSDYYKNGLSGMNPLVAEAVREWIDQGRSEDQIHGVINFWTGRGLALQETLPNKDAPQGAGTSAAPQPLNNLAEIEENPDLPIINIGGLTMRQVAAIRHLITAARAEGIKQGNQMLLAELKKAVALADKQARIDELKRNAYYSQPHKSDPLELCGIEMSAEQVNKRLAELEAK